MKQIKLKTTDYIRILFEVATDLESAKNHVMKNVRKIAEEIIRKYSKTFTDLANYDKRYTKYYNIDYKGKHFILSDTIDYDEYSVGETRESDITDEWLMNHVGQCVYYGIPPYVGGNEELRGRIDKVYKKFKDVGHI